MQFQIDVRPYVAKNSLGPGEHAARAPFNVDLQEVRRPELRDQILSIVLGSTAKGLLTGLAAGWAARRWNSIYVAVLVGSIRNGTVNGPVVLVRVIINFAGFAGLAPSCATGS